MGMRVHVAKTYIVEYGNTEEFNYAHDKFFSMLESLDASPCDSGGNSDYPGEEFECSKGSYDKAVRNLTAYIKHPDKLSAEVDADNIKCHLEELGMTAEELLDTMKSYRKEADTRDGYLHFSAF